jgi:hypothetical protein
MSFKRSISFMFSSKSFTFIHKWWKNNMTL